MLVFTRSRSQNARFNYENCFFFSFKRERGGAVGAEDESVNLNGSAGHEIAPPQPPLSKKRFRTDEKQLVRLTQVDF